MAKGTMAAATASANELPEFHSWLHRVHWTTHAWKSLWNWILFWNSLHKKEICSSVLHITALSPLHMKSREEYCLIHTKTTANFAYVIIGIFILILTKS